MSQRPTAKRVDPLGDVCVYECWDGLTPRAMAQQVVERQLNWRLPPGQGYQVVDFPDAPVASLLVSGVSVRETLEWIAELADGGCVIDSARRVLFCAREEAQS